MFVFLSVVAAAWIFLCTSLTMAMAQEDGNATDKKADQQAPSDEEKSTGGMKNQPKNRTVFLAKIYQKVDFARNVQNKEGGL